jgi:putative addiction module component (TIGR02574 family)
MVPSADAIFNAALSLPAENRAALAEKLLESLEQEDRKEIDTAWVEEAERRLQAYEQGVLKAIPGDEVLRSLTFGKKQ